MTTPLLRPLAREVLIDGTPYKATITGDGVRLTIRGHRKGFEVSWAALLAMQGTAITNVTESTTVADVRRAVVVDVSRDVDAAHKALDRVRTTLEQMGAIPDQLLASFEADPAYGRADRRADWFVEPLLTSAEVASILRVSQRTVQRLPLNSISLGGKRRFRQSEVRRFLARVAAGSQMQR